ncbi:hypothetical protein [Verrucosispora sioxanthis]|uniref:hypothetical protein n=1 Tax=Verrucosispora sioxanthis TaxID=2499994 RepID=UPI001C10439A|nr:hypothetical protein [Verrucosispora sioxanthis]
MKGTFTDARSRPSPVRTATIAAAASRPAAMPAFLASLAARPASESASTPSSLSAWPGTSAFSTPCTAVAVAASSNTARCPGARTGAARRALSAAHAAIQLIAHIRSGSPAVGAAAKVASISSNQGAHDVRAGTVPGRRRGGLGLGGQDQQARGAGCGAGRGDQQAASGEPRNQGG